MQDKRYAPRADLLLALACFALGAGAFQWSDAHACNKRGGKELGEAFDLRVTASELRGTPRILPSSVEVGDGEYLYKKGRKGTRVVMQTAAVQFEKVSE